MAFTAKDVAKLRELTGAGMMECKKALTATEGDMEKASEYLRERGVSVAEKKSSRLASEGAVGAYVAENGLVGSLVEINCESDFVARSDDFINLLNTVAKFVAEHNPTDLEACLNGKVDQTSTVQDLITAATAKIGEKISLRRFVCQSVASGLQESYLHMGGKIGVLLEVSSDKVCPELGAMCHDIAMHVAAFAPKYVYSCEVPANETEHEKAILRAQIANDPKTASKPQQVIDKMIEGRINKFFKEICLNDQEFAKDSSKTISSLVAEFNKANGANVKINRFSMFVMGEGLEKKCENLAEEISKITK